jgi:site-specific recombinase XerD
MLQGTPVRVVMETLGHTQISQTLGTYSHVSLNFNVRKEYSARAFRAELRPSG